MTAISEAMEDRRPAAPLTMVVPFCLGWSSAFAVGKIGLLDAPPLLFLGARFLLAGGVLLAAAAMLGHLRRLDGRGWAVLAALGVVNTALYLGLSFTAMKTVSSGLVTIIVSSAPVLTAGAAALLLGEALTWRKAAGLALGVLGVALIVRGRLGIGADDPGGILLAVGSLVAMVAGSLLYKRFAPAAGLVVNGGVQALAGGLALVPVGLLLEDPGAVNVTASLAVSLVYMVLVVSIGAHLLWYALLTRTTATAASAYHFLMPPLGLAFGWLLLGEAVQPWDLIGIVPVAAGIWLVTRATPAPRSV
ncbi:DMT family transporter [Azospirillum sp.]|uniref:DMT family transporter n=1 Tax=Azospirillum sp. TaxID=34012 RepID=UPI002D5EB146|nr:DMT family transporter [Azospirillum sp.]HYD65838.1 DMT family transporter [Azospirillum sp.]